jgi:Phage protein (N4 Gp49/phage Sf6 gene 66) family
MADVSKAIVRAEYMRVPDTNSIVCALVTQNGHVVIGQAHCQPATTYVEETGQKAAFTDALNKLFDLEVYLLREAILATKSQLEQV